MTHDLLCCLPRLSILAALLAGLSGGLTALEATAAPPAPVAPIITSAATRFTDNGNGTVTDSITGLIWLKNANCFSTQPWATALTSASGLASGACGLSDGSTAGQWRLPSRNELQSLVEYTTSDPSLALPSGHPFTDVQSDSYWSSTTYAPSTGDAWCADLSVGIVSKVVKTHSLYVWPVRGGL